MKKKPSLSGQALPIIAATGVSQAVTALLFIVAARLSTVDLFGLAATSVALGMVISGLLDFGFNSFFTRDLAASRVSVEVYWAKAKTKIAIGAIVATVWFCVLIQFNDLLAQSSLIFLSVLTFQTLLVPLRAQSRGGLLASLFLVERLLAAVMFALLLQVGVDSATSLMLALVFGTGCAALVAMNDLRASTKGTKVRAHRGVPWIGSRNYGVSALSNSLQQLDLPLLTLFGGPIVGGIYGAINKWTQPLGIVANAFATASTPFIAKANSTKDAIIEVKKSRWIVWLSCFLAAAMVPLAPSLISTLLGAKYLSAVPVFQLLALGTIPGIVNQLLATGLQARGYDKQVARISASGVLLQLATVSSLAWSIGALGAAIAYSTLQSGVFIALTLLLIRKINLEDLS